MGTLKDYLEAHPIHELAGVSEESPNEPDSKAQSNRSGLFASVDPLNMEPYAPNLNDLVRLHHLVLSRRVTSILEFGVGKSTVIFDHALNLNRDRLSQRASESFRITDPFKCYSVDNSKHWLSKVKKESDTKNVIFHFSECVVSTFNGRMCTFYTKLPNVTPNLIYIDGPDQFTPTGEVNGLHTRSPTRLSMSADVLILEHFLLPGTLIVVDGRAANARFLRCNLQRNWVYDYCEDSDQHFFELIEEPLGWLNKKFLDFTLGSKFFARLDAIKAV